MEIILLLQAELNTFIFCRNHDGWGNAVTNQSYRTETMIYDTLYIRTQSVEGVDIDETMCRY